MIKSCYCSILLGAIFLPGPPVWAGPGDPDPAFGQGGVVLLDANPGSNSNDSTSPTCSAYQADGKLLVGGSRNFTIIRYDLAGNLDPRRFQVSSGTGVA
jgi:hypothetical protein